MPQSSTSGFSSYNVANVYVGKTYGGYYTWYAATAGSCQDITTDGVNATESIAPKGWKLPNATDYRTLILTYNATTNGLALEAAPLNFQRGGYYKNSTAYDVGSYSDYWTTTASSSSQAYFMPHNSSSATVANDGDRIDGMTLRCIATPPQRTAKSITELTYLQDFADLDNDSRESVINSMESERIYTLQDKRDRQDYKIVKLKDGNVWFGEELKIKGGTKLTHEDSNIATDFVLPKDADGTGLYTCPTGEVFYDYHVATAHSGDSLESGIAPYDISPKGWRLPKEAEVNGMLDLYSAKNSFKATTKDGSALQEIWNCKDVGCTYPRGYQEGAHIGSAIGCDTGAVYAAANVVTTSQNGCFIFGKKNGVGYFQARGSNFFTKTNGQLFRAILARS